MFRSIAAVVLLLFCCTKIHAAQPYRPVTADPIDEPWRWRSLPELKGLGLRCIAEAKDGAMWFGTNAGVMRYDGVTWTTYTPANGLVGAPVNVLYAAQDGSIYAGSDMGISRFREGGWRRVFPAEETLSWPIDKIVEAPDHSLWAATAWGGLHLETAGPTLYTTRDMARAVEQLAPDLPLSIVPDAVVPAREWATGVGIAVIKGSYLGIERSNVPMVIWALAPGGPGAATGLQMGDEILTVNGRLPDLPHLSLKGPPGETLSMQVRRKGRDAPFSVAVTRVPLTGSIRDFAVSDVMVDRDNSVWFGLSWGGEIVRYAPGSGRSAGAWRLFTAADGLGLQDRPRLAQTRDGDIWAVSAGGDAGVNRYDGRQWTQVRLKALGGNDIHSSILVTRDGTLWVGGHSGNLSAFRQGRWRIFKSRNIPIPHVRLADLLEAADGSLWIAGLGQEAVRLDYGTSRWLTYDGLRFQAEGADGSLWFLSEDGGVVHNAGAIWTRYDTTDGLMDAPQVLRVTRKGAVWVAGSRKHVAATAGFDPNAPARQKAWTTQVHPKFAEGVDPNALLESADGSLWFGAASVSEGFLGGVLRFDGKTWRHYTGSEAPVQPYAMAQTPDGAIWVGSPLRRFDGQAWTSVTDPPGLASWVQDLIVTRKGVLWVGTRTYGAFAFDGQTWRQYTVKQGLADNQVDGLLEMPDGSIWASTPEGYSRFDGHIWTPGAFPRALRSDSVRGGLKVTRAGAVWLVRQAALSWQAVRYLGDSHPPETKITLSVEEVSQPGNTVVTWSGVDRWQDTPGEKMYYAYRLDGGPWSVFSRDENKVLTALRSGVHTFEVKARDWDFNEDPTPAAIQFAVVPPIWKTHWFVGLMAFLLGLIGFQTGRVVRRGRRLRQSNNELAGANAVLMQERALERLRVAIAALKSEENLTALAREIIREFTLAGMAVDLCVVGLIDEDLEMCRWCSSMRAADKGLQVEMALSQGSDADEALRPVGFETRQVDDTRKTHLLRMWTTWGVVDAAPELSAVFEAPFAHGAVWLGTSHSEGFSEAHRVLIERFVQELSMGYDRLLDARRLENQKFALERVAVLSETAGATAHEINQPLTVVVGMTQLLLQRRSFDAYEVKALKDILAAGRHISGIVQKMRKIGQYITKPYTKDAQIVDLDRSAEDENRNP